MNNDQSKLMNPPPPQQRMNPPPPLQVMNPVQPRIMNQAPPMLNQSQSLNHPIMVMNQQQPQAMLNNNNQPLMMNPRNYNLSSEYHNQPNNFPSKMNRNNNNNWKGKKIVNDKRPPNPMMRMRNNNSAIPIYNNPGGGGSGGYKPPALNELQSQNRLKTRKFYPKKKYGANSNRHVPYAPRNTTSFIIRAKKSGGIAELVSPSPVTPAVLPTPMFSPSREVLGDMAKEEWGVDGYGSMKGLIRLRSDGHDLEPYDDEDEDEGGSSESDVEEHVEVERRLDHDLSRFEMIYPSYGGGSEYNNVLENRVDDQDSHIAQLEEENLTLKERLFLMERELGDLRRRLQYLERRNMVAEDVNEEVVENNESESEGDDTGGSDARTSGDTKENRVVAEDVEAKETQHTIREVSGEQCEEANLVVVGKDQSKGNELAAEKVEDASGNDSIGEQGTTI
ncbi:unnamed protein product [Brassica rapa]|uniref:PRLI-interacting factor A n=2 Tax=Brassica campestris TaxID=3711 RepID=A0A3P6DDV1_BRACM|nr:unnamed protein product [Brassica rapa]VDD18772.1 unnamed protein product [Brassica rapa]